MSINRNTFAMSSGLVRYDRVRNVARTIADLAGEDRLRADHLAEALQFRMIAS